MQVVSSGYNYTAPFHEGLKYSSPSEFWNSCLQPGQWCFLAPLIIQTVVCSDNSPVPGWLDIRGSTIHEKLMDMLKRTSVWTEF